MTLVISEPVANILNSTDGNSYPFGSFTPAANSVLAVMGSLFTTNSNVGTISDTSGLTWIKRERLLWAAGNINEHYYWEATVGASPSATVITISCAGDDASGCIATCYQIAGNGVVFVQKASNASVSNNTPNITFPAAVGTNNCYIGSGAVASNPASVDVPSGWTSITDVGQPSSEGQFASYRVNGETGTTFTWLNANANAWGMIAAEYAEQAAPSSFLKIEFRAA